MELSNIKEFLEEYRKRLNIFDDERKQIIEVIFRISALRFTESQISLKQGVLTVDTDSVTRNELFIYKSRILEELEKISKKKIFDIV